MKIERKEKYIKSTAFIFDKLSLKLHRLMKNIGLESLVLGIMVVGIGVLSILETQLLNGM